MAAGEGDEEIPNMEVGLFVKGIKQSETWINISEHGKLIEIPAPPVIFALTLLLKPDALRKIESKMDSKGMLTNRILAQFGISLTCDLQTARATISLVKGPEKKPSDSIPAPPRQRIADASGPWTTPPVPALPGQGGDSAGSAASNRTVTRSDEKFPDQDWVPMKEDTSKTLQSHQPQSGNGTPSNGSAQPQSGNGSASKGSVQPGPELVTFQLDRTRDELFEDVFKHKAPPLPPSVEVTLLVDGKSYGTLWILYNKEQKRYTFPVDPVLNALQGLVRHDLWIKLEQRAKNQTRFTVEDLIACGFPTVLNTSVFELSTGVPAQLMGTKIHPMSGQVVDPYSVPAYDPSGFSAYLNTRARQRITYSQYNPSPLDSSGFGKSLVDARNGHQREAFIADLDGAINLKSWVVEGVATMQENQLDNSVDVRRHDIRMVHDWPRQSLRLTAGDLIFPTSGFQSFLKMGGVGLSRDFSLQPHLTAYPIKDFEFFLANPSEVKVFINGTLRGTYQLESGTHDLQGLSFTVGESQVEIQITDYAGQTQTLNFDFIHEPSLLAKGTTAFSYNIGVPSRDVSGLPPSLSGDGKQKVLNYEYDAAHPVAFLDYKRGMTNSLTLEAYSQAMDTGGMAGVDVLQALKIGKIKSDLAGSYQNGANFDWAGNLEYTYIPKLTRDYSPISWRLRTEYIGAGFYRPGQDPTLLGSLSFGGSFQKNSAIANVNLSAAYVARPDSADFYSAFASVGHTWPRGLMAQLTLKNVFDRERYTNTTISATVNYYFGMDAHTITAAERVENHRRTGIETGQPPDWDFSTDLAWDYNASKPFPNSPVLGVTTSLGPDGNDYSGKAQWNGNQGVSEILVRRYEPKNTFIINNNVDLTLQTALVFADWNFALSRPVRNGFVLVKGINNEKTCDVLVNSTEVGYDAKSSQWLPGVIPMVSPYYLKKIHLDVINPPLGSNEDKTDFTLYPGYKSGYAVYVGSRATSIALGTLVLAQDKPASYQSFQAIPLDGAARDPVMGFTNQAGKFQLSRLQPGKYRIEMDVDGITYTAAMFLPKNSVGITNVGEMLLAPK
ncbi:MAG: hypothetical protein JWO30_3481 [Fibrobacteres bacterium]|nr:hypothetical protein [Fibrobacterota bacterium]